MEISISITKASVLQELKRTSAYVGQKTTGENGDAYSAVVAFDEDSDMVERFWNEACANVAGINKNKVKAWSASSSFDITWNMPSNFNEVEKDPLKTDVSSYIVNYVLWQWLALGNAIAERSALYQQIATAYLVSIRTTLAARVKQNVEEGEAENNGSGEAIESYTVEDGDSPSEEEGGNEYGDLVNDFTAEGGEYPSEEEEGNNDIGDLVNDFTVDNPDDPSKEAEGNNDMGDIVNDFIAYDTECPEELEGKNVMGENLPQGFGYKKVKVYRIGRER